MVKPKQVGHLVLNVRDVEASEKFYTEVLGFEIAMKRPNATFLTCGQVPPRPRPVPGQQPSPSQLQRAGWG